MGTLGTASALRAKLRRRVGHRADTAILTDDELNDALNDALREVNKHFPQFALGSFTTVADQQAYSPLPSGGRRLERVFWGQTVCDALTGTSGFPTDFDREISSLFGNVSEDGIRYAVDPTALYVIERQREWIERWVGKGAVIADVNSVYLRPKPTIAGTVVYFIYSLDRFASVDVVDDSIEEIPTAFLARARWYAFDVIANGRGAMTEAKGPDGTTFRTSQGTRAADARNRADEEFQQSLPIDLVGWPDILR